MGLVHGLQTKAFASGRAAITAGGRITAISSRCLDGLAFLIGQANADTVAGVTVMTVGEKGQPICQTRVTCSVLGGAARRSRAVAAATAWSVFTQKGRHSSSSWSAKITTPAGIACGRSVAGLCDGV